MRQCDQTSAFYADAPRAAVGPTPSRPSCRYSDDRRPKLGLVCDDIAEAIPEYISRHQCAQRTFACSAPTTARARRVCLVWRGCMVIDRLFSEPGLAALYDLWNPWKRRGDFGFYLPMVMSAEAVLDVGCGTGELLRLAREAGHAGRLCGVDPADAMLDQARARSDIEWILGDLASVHWDQEFDLVVMTGHAFQVFVEDDEIRRSLATIRSALTEGGRFAFETRNPLIRAWERWIPDNAVEITDATSTVVRMAHEVETPVHGDVVSFTTTFTSPDWDRPKVSQSTLRFLDTDALSSFLSDAGLGIVEQFGNWDRQPLTATSPEIITITRRG